MFNVAQRLIHPRLAQSWPRVFKSTCAILAPPTTVDEQGFPISESLDKTTYTQVAGLEAILCSMGKKATRDREEQRSHNATYTNVQQICTLDKVYPQIKEQMVAIVTDPDAGTVITYNIEGIVPDPSSSQMQLVLEVVV